MAIGFVFMWVCGYTMTSLVAEDSALEEILFDLHISAGVTLLVLLLVRIAIRMLTTRPPLPPGISRLDRTGARLGHAALYALPAIIMAVGWMEVDFEGHAVAWFGISLPKVFPTLESWRGLEPGQLAATAHQWLAYALLGVALVHVAAVVKHRFFDGHDILRRMSLRKPQ
jgi:cytochrome b561